MALGSQSAPFFGAAGAAGGAAGYEIERSLRFNSADSAYLDRTPASAGNRTTWTWAGWVKKAVNDERLGIFGTGTSDVNWTNFFFDNLENNTIRFRSEIADVVTCDVITQPIYRDPSAWYHLVFTLDATNSTSADRVKIYINGVRQALTTFTTPGNSSSDYLINTTNASAIGARSRASFENYFDGYLADIHFIDGQALDPTDFGEFDATSGVWNPIAYTGSYPGNSFRLDFADNSSTTSGSNVGIGKDVSGNGNYWDSNNISVTEGNGNYITGTITAGTNDGTISEAFDGVLTRTVNAAGISTANGNVLTYTLPSTVNYSSKVEIAGYRNNFGTGYAGLGTADPTGGVTIPNIGTGDTVPWTTLVTGSGSFNAVSVRNSSERVGWVGLRIDGVTVLIDNSVVGAINDSLRDSPTNGNTASDTGLGGQIPGNYATLNPLDNGGLTISNGNLDYIRPSNGYTAARATIGMSSGKWYWEQTIVGSPNAGIFAGISDGGVLPTYPGQTAASYGYSYDGDKYTNNSASAYGASYTTGDVLGIAFDADAGTLTFYKNGSSQGSAFTSLTSGPYFPTFSSYLANAGSNVNFGQRAFAYSAPSGFKALCTANLDDPTIADGSAYMDAKLYTGEGSVALSITGLGFSPDLVWVKSRSNAEPHILFDTVRGAPNGLTTSDGGGTAAEFSNEPFSSFDSAGWSYGTGTSAALKNSGYTYVGWAWDAGSSTVSNTDGSITSQVRANATAGFSIVTYSGSGSSATVGHGLGVTPQMVIAKRRNAAGWDWPVWHTSLTSSTYTLFMNLTDAQANRTDIWDGAPTSTVFKVNTSGQTNNSAGTYVAYCFAPVEGYSAFGSYTGNGDNNGPFVYTGHRSRFILIKGSSFSISWVILDTARNTYNIVDQVGLRPNASDADSTDPVVDVVSNGFKMRKGTASLFNTSGATYVWASFAENPFSIARAR